MPKPKLKAIPNFSSEDEEREFWATHDSTDYVDWSTAQLAGPFSNLKRTEGLLEILLPPAVVPDLKLFANKRRMTNEELAQFYIEQGIARDAGNQ